MKPIKWYNLTRGDRAKHGDEILTFHRVDGAYAHWTNEQGELVMGNHYQYELIDGIYIPVTNKE